MSDPINATELTSYDTSERSLPILPVRDTVLFPHAVLPLTVGRESSVQLINSLGEDKTIVVVAQREARVDTPQPTDLYAIGTLAVVHKVVKMPNQSLFVFAEGLERVRLGEFTQLAPFMRAKVSTIPEATPPDSSEIEALQRNRSGGQELLDAVANTVSRTETVWLNSLARKGNQLTLTGTAGSINAVAEYITQLRRSGYFQTVEIKETHQNDNPDVQLFEFTVTADFAPPAANQTATPPTAPTPAPTAAPKRVG